MSEQFRIRVHWGPRRESAVDCAHKMSRTMTALAALDPMLERWFLLDRKGFVPVALDDVATVAKTLEYQQKKLADGPVIPEEGFPLHSRTNRRDPFEIAVDYDVGAFGMFPYFPNRVTLISQPLEPANASFVNLRLFKPAILALSTIWNANWAYAHPDGLPDLLPRDRRRMVSAFYGGWLTYLSPAFASKIVPPRSVICEEAPGGGLLMIATTDTFDIRNSAHVAVARDVCAALAPLNALPFPPNDTADGLARP